ncbi:MAG: helix-turn-helix domain-containing protein [Candidatus Dormibacteraceae bacterium]
MAKQVTGGTMALTIFDRQPTILADDERAAVAQLARLPVDEFHLAAKLVGPDGEEIALPDPLIRVLQRAAQFLLRGDAITIVPIDKELTTQEAADFLNMSRQYLVQLLERGEIPFTRTGTHRRIKFGDLLTYKQRRDAQRRRILDELTQLGQDMGDYTPGA